MPTARSIRILLADDHPIVRDGLIAVLSTQADFDIVGAVGDGHEVLALVESARPDLLLLDLEMPGLDGVELLRRLQAQGRTLPTLVFTAFDTDERILDAIEAGAHGYLLKGAPREELFAAVRVVAQGGSLLQPVVASRLLRRIRHDERPDHVLLTPREREVLGCLAKGFANREIARELVVTERTVKFHVSSILAKLGATNRTEAVTMAAQRGLVDL